MIASASYQHARRFQLAHELLRIPPHDRFGSFEFAADLGRYHVQAVALPDGFPDPCADEVSGENDAAAAVQKYDASPVERCLDLGAARIKLATHCRLGLGCDSASGPNAVHESQSYGSRQFSPRRIMII